MKKLITFLFVAVSMTAFAQEKTTNSGNPAQPRTAATSAQAVSSPLPYDVNDKYMGRKAEFLNNLIVSELPADFPVYDKKWSLKEYNQQVDAFYRKHSKILKDAVKQKLSQK